MKYLLSVSLTVSFFFVQQLVVTDTKVEIPDLEMGAMYNFFVVSRNRHGTSLPSSVLVINVTHTGMQLSAHTVKYTCSMLQSMKSFLLLHKLTAEGPPLWSNGRSSWLQIRRPGFDSRHYQNKK
jgi:hypothetical protein